MSISVIFNVLSDSNLSEREKFDSVCNHLQEFCPQSDHILNCFRKLNRLKSELIEFSKDADKNGERFIVRVLNAVNTELKIVKYQIENPQLMAKNEMPKFKRKHWTASIPGLVEIIYLMKNCVDHGNVEVKEIADWFEYIFQVKLNNIYKIIEQIASRKSKTKFLDEEMLNLTKFLEDFSVRKPRS